jgi:hypothetical protein
LLLGKELLQNCYESKDYELALYVAENLNSLGILKEEEKSNLVKEVQGKRDQLLKEHLESLEGWIAKADFSHPNYEGLGEGEIEDFHL